MPRQDKDGAMPTDKPSRWTATDGDEPLGDGVPFKWGTAHAPDLIELLDAANDAGEAVSFAKSRDGLTGSITILSGTYRPRWRVKDRPTALARIKMLLARYDG